MQMSITEDRGDRDRVYDKNITSIEFEFDQSTNYDNLKEYYFWIFVWYNREL